MSDYKFDFILLLDRHILKILIYDEEIREHLEMLALPELKRYISSKREENDFKNLLEKGKRKNILICFTITF